MVLAIGVPALATIEDVSPPVWGGTTPSANVVWQIDTEYGVPTCTQYDPAVGDPPEYYFGSHEGGETGTWDPCSVTFTLAGGDFLHALVEVPGGVGENLTIRVQSAMEGTPDFEETNVEIWASGKEDFAGEMATNAVEDPPGSGVWVQEGTFTPDTPGVQSWFADEGNIIGILNGGPFTMTGMIIDVIRHNGDAPTSGPGRDICGVGLPNPIIIDPNVMTVYETGETEGDFGVSLRNEPPVGATITITVDPNTEGDGPSEDITLFGGDPCDGSITFTRTIADWNDVTTISFKAIDDDIAEPPELLEPQTILVSSSWPAHPTDANFVGEKNVTAYVMDNDQADILFELVGTGPIRETPVKLLEQRTCTFWYGGSCLGTWVTYTQTIGVTMQVKPENNNDPCEPGYVRVIVSEEGGAGNPPSMDPPLLPDGPVEPNAIVFTSDGNPVPGLIGAVRKWDVPFNIVLLGNDDEELQAEGAEAEGGQNYQASLVFSVIDTTDERYTPEIEPEGLERTVDINIEDNECGAFGILPVDVGNPYYLMDEETLGGDPNDWLDDDGNPMPDCRVDIYDVLELANRWLNCSDPLGTDCTQYNL